MILLDVSLLLGVAAVISAMSSLVWAMRRKR